MDDDATVRSRHRVTAVTMPVMSDAPSRLEITDDAVDALRVAGEIDAHSAPEFAARLRTLGGSGDRRVDMAGVEFMDSSGLRVLIEAHRAAEADGARLVVVAPGRVVSRIIEVSGLADHLHVESPQV